MKEIEVDVPPDGDNPGGKFVLMRPKAGMRNKAIITAETPQGIKQTVLVMELLPVCVKTHPWRDMYRSIREGLDDLEIAQYDVLLKAMGDLVQPPEDAEKKSVQSSGGEPSSSATR